MKRSWIGWGLLVVATLGILLFTLSFRIMQSQTASDSAVAASKSGGETDSSAGWVISGATTGLSVIGGDNRLQTSIQNRLVDLLKKQPNTGLVQVLETRPERVDFQVLSVEVIQQKFLWTPFYANSAYQVKVAYASNGDVSFSKIDPPHFVSKAGEGPVIQYSGTYAISDVSKGLISRPGYQDYLAEKIAATIIESMQKQLES